MYIYIYCMYAPPPLKELRRAVLFGGAVVACLQI